MFQDSWRGGITAAGGYTGESAGTINFNLDIESMSTIKKAYIIAGANGKPEPITINLNGNLIEFSENSSFTNTFIGQSGPPGPTKNYFQEVTEIIDSNVNNYTLTVPAQNNLDYNRFAFYYLIVCYENQFSPVCASSIIIHDQNVQGILNYNLNDLSAMNTSEEIALSFNGFTYCSTLLDGSFVLVNSNNIGSIGGEEPNSLVQYCDGVNSHFKYSNNTIVGISNDTPDNLMNGTDALANINNYVTNYSTSLNLKLEYFNLANIDGCKSNSPVCWVIAYSTPCQPQNVTVTPDTTICPDTQVQLSATGGTSTGTAPAYEWWPHKDLSCYDCPNPIFSGDSSQLYTVRIWGNDSCSVVRPIMIHVRTKPKTTLYNQSNSLCADSTAFVNWQTAGANTYSLDNGAFQPAGFYNQLPAGEHLLTVRDAFGCTYDTLVLIDDYSSVVANLSVSPLSGEAPLVVQITNQSTEFTDYSWSVNNNIQPNASNSFEAFTAGEYTIQLIAWQNDPTCADTAFQTISVTSAGFYILGSSLVSASSNAQNTFSVLTNGTPIVKVNLYDVQGRLLKTKTILQLIAGSNTIWSASELSDIASEMVLYRIEWQNAAESGELKGKVLILK